MVCDRVSCVFCVKRSTTAKAHQGVIEVLYIIFVVIIITIISVIVIIIMHFMSRKWCYKEEVIKPYLSCPEGTAINKPNSGYCHIWNVIPFFCVELVICYFKPQQNSTKRGTIKIRHYLNGNGNLELFI